MILAVDVCYLNEKAIVGGILFSDWTDAKPCRELVISCQVPDAYMPGQFYRRELPCIGALLEQVPEKLECIVIDGFVYLGRHKEPGLGKHLRDMLDRKVVVIGVAKTPYQDTPESCRLLRGAGSNPLYVTASGISVERAKLLISSMHGQDRIPTLLRHVDRLCRAAASR